MTPKQIKFFRKLSVKLVIILLIIVPIDLFYSHWLLGHYGEGLSLLWHLYIGGINGIALGGFFTLILSYFYDAYLDKREFIDYCREKEEELRQETRDDMKTEDKQAHPLEAPIYDLAKSTTLSGLSYLMKKSDKDGNIAAVECFNNAFRHFICGIELFEKGEETRS
jgi:hypothetical protein